MLEPMGNRRDSMTDEEWDEEMSKIKADRKNGKPEEQFLHLAVYDLSLEVLEKLKESLSPYYNKWDLSLIEDWIKWKKRDK